MSRYIDADALIDTIGAMIGYRSTTPTDIWHMVSDAPSIDIVRCKECKHWTNGDDTYGICYRCPNTRQMRYDDYCSYGEREGE